MRGNLPSIPWRQWIAISIPVIATALLVWGAPFASDNDVYLHLLTGRLTWDEGQIVRFDRFTYLAAGQPDETHSWLGQTIFWLVFRALGPAGLFLTSFLAAVTVLVCAWRYLLARRVDWRYALIATTFAVLLHRHFQLLRPLMFGEALCAVMLLGLWPTDGFTWRRLGVVIAVVALWANLHGSVAMLLPLFALHALRELVGKRRWPSLLAPVLALLAMSLTPMGWSYFRYLREITAQGKRLGNLEWLAVKGLEWPRAPYTPESLFAQYDVIHVLIVLGIVATAYRLWVERERALWPTLECAYFLALPFVSLRHAIYLFYPLVVQAAWYARTFPLPLVDIRSARLSATAAPLLALVILATGPIHQSGPTTDGIANATTFLEQTGFEGNVFCLPRYSNFLSYRLHPKIRVALDPRTRVNLATTDRLAEFRNERGDLRLREWLRTVPQTDLVLLPSTSRFEETLDGREWLLVYENDSVSIALHRDERNRANLDRITSYYAARKVPFHPQSGFAVTNVSREARDWFVAQQEKPSWGRWPAQVVVERWKQTKRSYSNTRGIQGPR